MAIPSQYIEFYEKMRSHFKDSKEKLGSDGDIDKVMDEMFFGMTKDFCRTFASKLVPPSESDACQKENSLSTRNSTDETIDEKISNSENSPLAYKHQLPEQKKFKCQESNCNKTFDCETDLNVHNEAHLEPRPLFKCSKKGCNTSYRTPDGLARHSLSHTNNPRPFKCQFADCDKTYSSKYSLKKHGQIHSDDPRPHKCPVTDCTKSYRYKLSLEIHLRNIHSDHPLRFECTAHGCNKVFTSKSSVINHQQRKHSTRPTPKFDCLVPGCGKSFSYRHNLRKHATFNHSDNVKNIRCSWSQCEYASYYRKQVYKHIRSVHFGLLNKNEANLSERENTAICRYIKMVK